MSVGGRVGNFSCFGIYKISQHERITFIKWEFFERESDKGGSVFSSPLGGQNYNGQVFIELFLTDFLKL